MVMSYSYVSLCIILISLKVNSLPNSTTHGQPFDLDTRIEGLRDPEITDEETLSTLNETSKEFNSRLCDENVCVMKCCPEGEMVQGIKCIPTSATSKPWELGLYDVDNELLSSKFQLLNRLPDKPSPKADCFIFNQTAIRIQKNGFIYVERLKTAIGPRFYCLDAIDQADDEVLQPKAVVCYELKSRSGFSVIARYIIIAFQIVSILSLAIIVLFYLPISITPNLQDTSFLCLCFSLLIVYIISILIISPAIVTNLSSSSCIFLGYAAQFVYLTFHFWLMIRCYDIFRMVKGGEEEIPLSTLSAGHKGRFLKYCLIAYGIPMLVTLFTIIIQLLPASITLPFSRPNIGVKQCWIQSETSALIIYYVMYQVTLHILSLTFMGISAWHLYKNSVAFQCCRKVKESDELTLINHKPNLQMFYEQFCIFAVAITLMAMDSVSFIYWEQEFWKIIDILNALQGLYFLIIALVSPPRREVLLSNLRSIRNASRRLINRDSERLPNSAADPPESQFKYLSGDAAGTIPSTKRTSYAFPQSESL